MFNQILTVCTGNICRSPAAEYLLRARLEQNRNWQGSLRSAGIGAPVGSPADETTQEMMLSRGVDLGAHRATQLTLEHLRWADLVLVMENYQRRAVLDIDPTARGKTFLLGHWMEREIPDPYRGSKKDHAEAIALIDAAIDTWIGKLGDSG